jgi:hypothetical protein
LDPSSSHDSDMRTIFSNKFPGCESSSKQNGISLYINGWQSHDHRLYLEYGGTNSGCNKVVSEESFSSSFSLGKWYHIASYISETLIVLWINGEVVAKKEGTDIVEPHNPQYHNPMLFGQYATGEGSTPYVLYGNLSEFIFLHTDGLRSQTDVISLTTLVQSLQKKEYLSSESLKATFYAYYPFTDYKVKAGKVAKDLIHSNNAAYICQGGNIALGDLSSLNDGVNDREVTPEMIKESNQLGYARREKIKEGMRHVWKGYKTYAFGRDELKPLSNHGQDNWGGIGMTILDSLDTLWILGLKAEFAECRQWIAKSLSFSHAGTVSVFEITIRALGGLLAAYDLSQDSLFLEKAKDLGDRLIHAFQTRSGIPSGMINLNTGSPSSGWSGNNAILSELGTLQVEFRYLGEKVKNPSYEETSMKPMKLMAHRNPPNGLYPIKVRIDDGQFADSMITFGALGDSFYEYLLKLWLQGGRKETWLREMYDKTMDGAISKLLLTSSKTGLSFFSDWNGHSNFRKMDHLVCFVPGMLALGAYTDPNGGLSSSRAQRDLKVAKALMYTCYQMYSRQSTGISPEYVEFPAGGDMVVASQAPFYILRPETAESLFILNQLTGDPIYRQWAWEIWSAIDKECKTGSGYAALRNVNNRNAGLDDRMESFFLAETIKYLYLAQDPDKPVDLMKVVFNTEAHPLTVLDDSHQPVSL